MERRRFLATAALGLPLLGSSALLLPVQSGAQEPVPPVKPAQLEPELVKEFVRVGHNDLAEVQHMLKERPGLLNASWDVGGGDFETAWKAPGTWVTVRSLNT